MKKNKATPLGLWITMAALLVAGQAAAFLISRDVWENFYARLPAIIAMIAFWGPICAIFSSLIVLMVLRLLGFESLEAIRSESVDQNNPTPAIHFVGTLIASVLFLLLVIRP
jgi:hypothetical protein